MPVEEPTFLWLPAFFSKVVTHFEAATGNLLLKTIFVLAKNIQVFVSECDTRLRIRIRNVVHLTRIILVI